MKRKKQDKKVSEVNVTMSFSGLLVVKPGLDIAR